VGALAAATVISALAWPVYGGHAFRESLEILAPLGALTTVLSDVIAGRPRGQRALRRELLLVAALAVGQLAAALALFASVMFVSRMDAFFMALAAGYAALVGLAAGRVVARRALGDLDAVRSALARVGEGERNVHIDVAGGDELSALAADVEAMVQRLAAEERARRDVVAALSHDLRTPLTNLRLIADGLRDGIFGA
jgi:signal transduction histidine kinase